MKIRHLFVGIAVLSLSVAALSQTDDFAVAMDSAMNRMHHVMMVTYTGDADHDFAAMMIPHHQGAIDMAEIELRYGKDERLRRLAQGIIVEQRQEIVVMQSILSKPLALSKQTDPAFSGLDHPGDHQ